MDRVMNRVVLKHLSKETEVPSSMKGRKLAYFAHVIGNPKYEILLIVIQEKIEGKHAPGW